MASTTVISVALALVWLSTAIGLLTFIRGIISIVRELRNSEPDHTRSDNVLQRTWTAVWIIISHRTFKGKPVVKVAHWLVMFSFVALIGTLVRSYFQVRNPSFVIPVFGSWPIWLWISEFFAWAGALGILALIGIRIWVRLSHTEDPRFSRFYGSTRWQAYFVEAIILTVCLCVIVLHGLDYTYEVHAGGPQATVLYYPFSWWLGELFVGLSSAMVANMIVIVSAVKIVASMLWMTVVGVETTMGISWHRFLAPINLFAGRYPDGRKSLGGLPPLLVDGNYVSDLEDLPDDAVLGVGDATDLTWKDQLDLLSCTECGRCQAVCPAWNTEKPLSPKLLTLAMRDNAASASSVDVSPTDGPPVIESGVAFSPHSFDIRTALEADGIDSPLGTAPFTPDVLGEMIWDCTMCGACVDQCPVDIEHVDRIANLRRFQVLMESAFPRELAGTFKSMQTKGNPYGRPARARLEWAKNLDFPVPVIGEDVEDASEVDYLFWVGCAGAYDDKQKKTTAAVAELLHTAGVSFAVLGGAESCTGDPARRAGNEMLFQLLAQGAVETLNEAKATRIIVSCAHCFNTIANEFPDLGGSYEVIHHTQILNRLVREGLLTPVASENPEEITYHDPCFLGRYNGIFEAPRELLGGMPGVSLVEMANNRDNSVCCGAGGARAWMEESQGKRISTMRMEQAEETGASTVATACPFCTQMLSSAPGFSHAPEVKDVAQLLVESVRRGQSENHPHQ